MRPELKTLCGELLCHLRSLNEDDVRGIVKDVPAPDSPPAMPQEKNTAAAELARLSTEVSGCRRCALAVSRIKPVFGVGSPAAGVMFVGEGPGYEEDRKGEPFVGKAGQLLDKILAAINLSRETVYITNIVKCHPMADPSNPEARGNDRPPAPEEVTACRPYLDAQIAVIRPRCIVALGAPAAKTLLNTSQGITALRGKWHTLKFSHGSVKVLPVYHPAALLRNPSLKLETWKDMKSLRDFLTSATGD